MSVVKTSPYKQPDCGVMGSGTLLLDGLGGVLHLQIVGTDPNVGIVDGSALVTDYAPPAANTNYGTFLITIETDAATYYVSLEDGSDFIITPAQSTSYLGQWYPAKLLSVNVGTTGDFSVGY